MNSNDKLVSILIPNFNKEEFLTKTLQSILDQEYQNWECILVDDGSTDGSLKVLHEFAQIDARFRVFNRPTQLPKGANSCRNFAFSLSKGQFIQWFDSDDFLYPWFLRMKVEYLANHPEIPFVVSKGKVEFQNGYTGNRKFAQNLTTENLVDDYLRFKILFFIPGPLFRRNVFEQVGLFNGKLKRHQEWELFLRVVLNFPEWGIITTTGFVYNVNGNSITFNHAEKKAVVESELAVFKAVLSSKSNQFKAAIPKKIRLRLAFKYLLVSLYHLRINYSIWYFPAVCRELLLKPSSPN